MRLPSWTNESPERGLSVSATKSGQDFQNVPRGDHFGSWCRSLVVISSRSLGWTEVSSGGSKRKCHHCSVVFRVRCERCQGDLLPGCPPRSPLYHTASRQCYAHRFFQHGYVTASRLSECCVLWTLTWPKAHSNPKAPNQGLLPTSLPFQAVSRAVGVRGWGTPFLKGTMRKSVTGCGTSMSEALDVRLSRRRSGNRGSNSCLQGAKYRETRL